jgi:EpsD family peptidyl-prolyl cis-trans isomerase
MKRYVGTCILATAVAMSLYGCGEKKEGEEPKASQVAAKVDGDEITVHQLNHEVTKLGNVNPEQAQQIANQVLKGLVDQTLLMNKAIEEKLDRDPEVLQTLESNRRQILAQAYLQRHTDNAAKPTDAEISDYFNQHPELFSERRIYRLQEISVQVTPQNVEAVKKQLAASKNLGDFAQWLKANSIPARAGQSVKTAEQLPLEILPRLHKLKDGQALTLQANNSLNILVLAGSQTQPMAREQATQVIERYLTNARKRELAEAELKKLRDAAKVEYLGAYADAGKVQTPAPAAAAPQATPQPAEGAAPAAAPAPAPAGGAPMDQNALEQGLKGLN